MSKLSAGLLVYRVKDNQVEVLLGHPGGPFWAKKDRGAWSIPKGEYEEDEPPMQAAYREFTEELGQKPPKGEPLELGSIKRSDGKVISVWAIRGDLDVSSIASNTFTMEWPPKSGRQQEFPEIDQAAWFRLDEAAAKLHKGQAEFVERLAKKLGVEVLQGPPKSQSPQQTLL